VTTLGGPPESAVLVTTDASGAGFDPPASDCAAPPLLLVPDPSGVVASTPSVEPVLSPGPPEEPEELRPSLEEPAPAVPGAAPLPQATSRRISSSPQGLCPHGPAANSRPLVCTANHL